MQRVRSQEMSGQSWHEVTVSRRSRHWATAKTSEADVSIGVLGGRLMTQCGRHVDHCRQAFFRHGDVGIRVAILPAGWISGHIKQRLARDRKIEKITEGQQYQLLSNRPLSVERVRPFLDP